MRRNRRDKRCVVVSYEGGNGVVTGLWYSMRVTVMKTEWWWGGGVRKGGVNVF